MLVDIPVKQAFFNHCRGSTTRTMHVLEVMYKVFHVLPDLLSYNEIDLAIPFNFVVDVVSNQKVARLRCVDQALNNRAFRIFFGVG